MTTTKTKIEKKLNETIERQQVELDKNSKMIKELTNSEKAAVKTLKKLNSHIKVQEEYINQLKEENKYIPQITLKIKEYANQIENISVKFNEEKKKNEKLIKEKESIEKMLEGYHEKSLDENSMEYIKSQIEMERNCVNQLTANKETMEIKISELQLELKNQENYFAIENENMVMNLKYLYRYIENNFLSIDNSTIINEPVLQSNNHLVTHCFYEIIKSIKAIKLETIKNWKLLRNDNEITKRELIELKSNEGDIMNELEKYKIKIKNCEEIIKERENDIEILKKTAEEDIHKILHEIYNELILLLGNSIGSNISFENNKLLEIIQSVRKEFDELNEQILNLKNDANKKINELTTMEKQINEANKLNTELSIHVESLLKEKEEVILFFIIVTVDIKTI